jgi:hypothetical protein
MIDVGGTISSAVFTIAGMGSRRLPGPRIPYFVSIRFLGKGGSRDIATEGFD